MLDVAVARQLGDFRLDVALTASAGETLVVVGESGSGKTTLLRLLAGLDRPDAGRITLGADNYCNTDLGRNTPPWQRSVGYVPQDYALFPHLTVFDNVAFGLRVHDMAPAEVAGRVGAVLDQVGIAALANGRPAELSGGQQQRAALARALVLQPALLLLDEPLSALDLRSRHAVRTELRRILPSLSCVTIYVTHTPSEALMLGHRIAVLEQGKLTQIGDREEFLRRPRSAYVAAFLGINLFPARVVNRSPDGIARVAIAGGELEVLLPDPTADDLLVTVSPRAVALHLAPPSDRRWNLFRGLITEMIPEPPDGERVRIMIHAAPPLIAEASREALSTLGLQEGDTVWVSFEAADTVCYP